MYMLKGVLKCLLSPLNEQVQPLGWAVTATCAKYNFFTCSRRITLLLQSLSPLCHPFLHVFGHRHLERIYVTDECVTELPLDGFFLALPSLLSVSRSWWQFWLISASCSTLTRHRVNFPISLHYHASCYTALTLGQHDDDTMETPTSEVADRDHKTAMATQTR